jgi:hypothetical protein
MPDKYGFDHLPNWGVVTVACVEPDCTAKGPMYEWPLEKREQHHLIHLNSVVVESEENPGIIFTGHLRRQKCRDCGDDFYQVRKRGRPALSCEKCRGIEEE